MITLEDIIKLQINGKNRARMYAESLGLQDNEFVKAIINAIGEIYLDEAYEAIHDEYNRIQFHKGINSLLKVKEDEDPKSST